MCHYCHKLGHNKRASPHKSIDCQNSHNTYSKYYKPTRSINTSRPGSSTYSSRVPGDPTRAQAATNLANMARNHPPGHIIKYDYNYKPQIKYLTSNTNIILGDMINISADMAAIRNFNVGLHNFANGYKPGGCARNGRTAQEESICQRVCGPLASLEMVVPFYLNGEKPGDRPTVHITPYAFIVNDSKFRPCNHSASFKVISSAAPNISRYPNFPNLYDHWIKCWYATLQAAVQSNINVFITGLWGCGVYRNDPNIVFSTLHHLLNTTFKDAFHYVLIVLPPNHRHTGLVHRIFS